MRALSIETATAVTAVGVLDGAVVVEEVADTSRRHTEALGPCASRLLAARGLRASDLDAVVVDVGPGLFTGLRVGIAFAKGLSVGTGAGLFAVTSTEVLAECALEAGVGGEVVCVVDARRAEVFAARYGPGELGPVLLDEVAVVSPHELAARLGALDHVTLVGDGAARYREVLSGDGIVLRDDVVVPSPGTALRLVARRIGAGAVASLHERVAPSYLREADAVANFAVRPGTP